MDNNARLRAGKHQLRYYMSCQYPMWRVVMVKSIRRILDNLNEFYAPIREEIRSSEDEIIEDTEQVEIRNGLFFEALSQSVQAVEDLFSLMKNCNDTEYFAKKVITYKANEVTQYIRGFDSDNLESVLKEFHVPYFSPNDPWENREVFNQYCIASKIIQEYVKELVEHHKTYYFHYCQYKHGLTVALRPYGTRNKKPSGSNAHEGIAMVFDNIFFGKRYRKSPPALMIPDVHPDLPGCITALHNEDNLLRAELKVVNIDLFVGVVEKAYTLLSVLQKNLVMKSEQFEDTQIIEYAFPTKNYQRLLIIGFPTGNSELRHEEH